MFKSKHSMQISPKIKWEKKEKHNLLPRPGQWAENCIHTIHTQQYQPQPASIPTICRALQHSVHQASFLVARKQGFDCRGCPRDICTTFYWTQCIGNVRDSIVTNIRQMREAATGKDGFRSDVTALTEVSCYSK